MRRATDEERDEAAKLIEENKWLLLAFWARSAKYRGFVSTAGRFCELGVSALFEGALAWMRKGRKGRISTFMLNAVHWRMLYERKESEVVQLPDERASSFQRACGRSTYMFSSMQRKEEERDSLETRLGLFARNEVAESETDLPQFVEAVRKALQTLTQGPYANETQTTIRLLGDELLVPDYRSDSSGYLTRKVAEELKLTGQTVRNHYRNTLKRLRELLVRNGFAHYALKGGSDG